MVSLKRTLVFLLFYVLYLLLGSFLFNAFECPQEVAVKRAVAKEEEEFMNLISHLETLEKDLRYKVTHSNLTSIMNRQLPQLIAKSKIGTDEDDMKGHCDTWSLYNSIFFSFSTITTIGYGTVTPKTQLGRGACLLYSIIGIPINSIIICFIGNFFINQESTCAEQVLVNSFINFTVQKIIPLNIRATFICHMNKITLIMPFDSSLTHFEPTCDQF